MAEPVPARRSARGERGLTTRGRCLLAGGIAAGLCAVLLDERDLLRVGILAIALPLVAMLLTMGGRVQVSATHQAIPDKLRPGSTGVVRLLLTNVGAGRTRSLEATEPATTDLTAGVRSLLPPLSRGETGVVAYPLTATRRGRFQLGPPRIRVSDPFGLWESSRILPTRTEVIVVPRVVPLIGMPAGSGAWSAASGRAASGASGGEPDVRIRQYTPGDDIRTMHWRASARHDQLMVRLSEPVTHGGTSVLLDHRACAHRGIGAASSLEVAVTLAASVSLHLLAADYQVRLVGHTGSVIALGNDIADDVLAGLADVQPDSVGDLAAMAAVGRGMMVAVLGDMEPALTRSLIAARSRSAHAVALLLDVQRWDPASGPTHPVAATAALLGAGGWRVVVIRPQDDLADAWHRACLAGDGFATRARALS